MKVLGIDPGTDQSAFVVFDGEKIDSKGIIPNNGLLSELNFFSSRPVKHILVIEQIRSYGMPIGATTLDTVFWSGRFWQVWDGEKHLMPRLEVKKHLCHNGSAKDSNIRQALIDRFGPPGTKKEPGLLYGCKKDIWAALAIAVTWYDQNAGKCA
jgi:hypothetical protein